MDPRIHGCSSAQTGGVPTLRVFAGGKGSFAKVTAYKIMFRGGILFSKRVCGLKLFILDPAAIFQVR